MIKDLNFNSNFIDYSNNENQTTNISDDEADEKVISKTVIPNVDILNIEHRVPNTPKDETLLNLEGFDVDFESLIEGKPIRVVRRMKVSND